MKILLIFILLFTTTSDLKLIKQFSANSEIVLTDAIGNIYAVNGNNVTMYNFEGLKNFSYSNSFLGSIYSVDVLDPMRVLIFYKEFNKVIFLSNKLSEISSAIELDNLGYSQISACCNSNLGGFWIFNAQQMQLVHLNSNLESDRKGTNIQSVLQNNDLPVYMLEQNDEIFVSAPKSGVLIFDKFGTYKKTIPLYQLNKFQVVGDKFIYLNNNKIFSYSTINNTDSLSIPENLKIKSASIYKNKIVVSNSNEIYVYEL